MTNEQIKEMARNIAGCDIMVRVDEVDSIVAAGWDAIEIGTVVYKNSVQDATKTYTKTGENEVTTQSGQKAQLNDSQKQNMVETYAMISIIGQKEA